VIRSEGPPRRIIVQADALVWMPANPAPPTCAVVTSLPDVSELPELGFPRWRRWFIDAAAVVLGWVPRESVAIFYQTDIRHEGVWVDKAYLVSQAAEATGAALLWHKIICRKPPGTMTHGRASYTHMLAFAGSVPLHASRQAAPDVLADAGQMPWSKAMGLEACRLACRFLQDNTCASEVVDPFCGRGTVLAVANAMGFDARGIDVSARRCRAARSCRVRTGDGLVER